MGCSSISGPQIRKEMAEFGAIMTGHCEAMDGEATLDTVKQLCAHAGGKPKSATGGVFFDGPSFMKFWSALKDAGFSDVSKPTNTRRIIVKDGVRVELDPEMRTYKSKMTEAVRTEALDPSQKQAHDLVTKLAKKVDDLAKEIGVTVKALQKLGYDEDVTDWIWDAWGSIEGQNNQYAKKLLAYIKSGKR